MDKDIRGAQKEVLNVFSKEKTSFALAGGTALELYYLHHRFSVDLDFFSSKYTNREVNAIVSKLRKNFKGIKLESELQVLGKAKVRFYSVPLKGSRQLKIDFIEDVLLDKPKIIKVNSVQVYSAADIYFHKIVAITGLVPEEDQVGRQLIFGRNKARDVFDLYMLSKQIQPLHLFVSKIAGHLQRGLVHWYRSFSRQDLKLDLLGLDIYDKKFNAKEMIIYLENEIKQFIDKVLA